MARMTGGQALVASLHREGVRVIFGLPGVQLDRPVLIEVPVGRMPRPRFFSARRTPKRLDR